MINSVGALQQTSSPRGAHSIVPRPLDNTVRACRRGLTPQCRPDGEGFIEGWIWRLLGPAGKMVGTVEPKARMEEMKAEGARATTLLTPTPPHLTGKDAWAQDSVSSLRLHSDVRALLMTSSS